MAIPIPTVLLANAGETNKFCPCIRHFKLSILLKFNYNFGVCGL